MLNVLLSLAKENATQSPVHTNPQRKNLLNTISKLHRTQQRVYESYRKLKYGLKKLHDDYYLIKGPNIFRRYLRMQQIIREVIILDNQYWQLIDVPKPEPTEAVNDYVFRFIVNVTQPQSPPRSSIASLLKAAFIADSTTETINCDALRTYRTNQFLELSTEELQLECDRMHSKLYRLLRKYLELRQILKGLKSNFHSSRFLPIIPRYNLLKSMIKSVIREPTFAEIYHESDTL
ncbi:unnamed protein product [Thelazia callipaeda]|uniref:Uncharacterized protein n=1 Tax=Thelazia callipaeda TaxID=103827 RepID=A0A0N5CKD7_THECL|nr:unnamed protein product [Thelazia callipaeda]